MAYFQLTLLSKRMRRPAEKQTGQMLFSWKFCNNHVSGDSVLQNLWPCQKKIVTELDRIILYYECVFSPFWIFSRLLCINRLVHWKDAIPIHSQIVENVVSKVKRQRQSYRITIADNTKIEDKPLMQSGPYQIQIMVNSWARPTKQSVRQHKPSNLPAKQCHSMQVA